MKILGMPWENVDEFGDEQKILVMFILCVAEEHGNKGLATKLVKVGFSILKTPAERNQNFLKRYFRYCGSFLCERESSIPHAYSLPT